MCFTQQIVSTQAEATDEPVGLAKQTAAAQAESTDLNFSQHINNGEQEYRAGTLNKSLTEAMIPSYYNGLPITEIAETKF